MSVPAVFFYVAQDRGPIGIAAVSGDRFENDALLNKKNFS
jgi:hypothetical protein